jgi:hypothetical protein
MEWGLREIFRGRGYYNCLMRGFITCTVKGVPCDFN